MAQFSPMFHGLAGVGFLIECFAVGFPRFSGASVKICLLEAGWVLPIKWQPETSTFTFF